MNIQTRSTRRVVRHALFGLLLAIVAMPIVGRGQAPAKRAFETRDWYRVKAVGAPTMSPDGKFVAVAVTSVVEAANKRVSEVWAVGTAPGSEPMRISAAGVDSTGPRFSADSTTVIFTSTRPGYTGTQWAARVDRPGEFQYSASAAAAQAGADAGGGDFAAFAGRGGGAGPAPTSPKDGSFIVATGVEGGANSAAGGGAGGRQGAGGNRGGGGGNRGGGAPDGPGGGGANAAGGRAAAASNDPYGAMQPMAKPPANAVTLPLDPGRFDGMQITDAGYKRNGSAFIPSTGRGGGAPGGGGRNGGGGGGNTPPDNSPTAQILLDKKDGAGFKALTSTAYTHRNATVSPDGKWIVFAADAELRPDLAVRSIRDEIAKLDTADARNAATRDRLQSELFVMAVTGGTPKRIRTAGTETGIEWSADSRYFTFTASNGANTNTNIYLADVTAAASKSLTGDLRTNGGGIDWLPSNDALMQINVGGRDALFRINPKTGDRKEIVGGRRRVSGWSYDTAHSKVAYTASLQEMPGEVFLTDLTGASPERQLTNFNAETNNTIAWSPSERFTYKSVGDVEIEAWLVKPYGYEAGKKYPLVLYIHGGPHSAYNEGWFDEFQNLAGAGMWVLYTNPRGSSGYGAEFSNMIRARWGDEDYMDLMKAVDIAVARPDVDKDRLGVTGGSYGGFMTAWITTKTDRFKAAQADRMIVNWVSWYGTSDAQSLTEGEFLGTPWQQWDNYIKMSPIKYADKVKTPTLIVQSEEDYRAPIEDAEQWFNALKKNGVRAEFVRYPRSNHDLSRTGEPWLLTDRLGRIRQWFSFFLKDEAPVRLTAPK